MTDTPNKVPLPKEYDILAPSGFEVRYLSEATYIAMVHFQLSVGATSRAVRHCLSDELWYCNSGVGDIWLSAEEEEITYIINEKSKINISSGTEYQFRNTGDEPLCFIVTRTPPWPDDNEAVFVDGRWAARLKKN